MNKKNRFPLIMKSTAAVCAAATAVFILWDFYSPQEWLVTAAISTGTTCYHFTMRLLVGLVLDRAAVNENHPWFRQRGFEPKFYGILQVKHWKANMPTYNPDSFSLKHNSLQQIVRNSCTAELVHLVIIPLSFLPLFAVLLWGAFPVFLITSVLAALYDSIFVIMQRYNRPRLVRILKKKEASAK